MTTTSQRLEVIANQQAEMLMLLKNQHYALHLILRLQGVTNQEIEKILTAMKAGQDVAALVADLKAPTDDVAAALKKADQ